MITSKQFPSPQIFETAFLPRLVTALSRTDYSAEAERYGRELRKRQRAPANERFSYVRANYDRAQHGYQLFLSADATFVNGIFSGSLQPVNRVVLKAEQAGSLLVFCAALQGMEHQVSEREHVGIAGQLAWWFQPTVGTDAGQILSPTQDLVREVVITLDSLLESFAGHVARFVYLNRGEVREVRSIAVRSPAELRNDAVLQELESICAQHGGATTVLGCSAEGTRAWCDVGRLHDPALLLSLYHSHSMTRRATHNVCIRCDVPIADDAWGEHQIECPRCAMCAACCNTMSNITADVFARMQEEIGDKEDEGPARQSKDG